MESWTGQLSGWSAGPLALTLDTAGELDRPAFGLTGGWRNRTDGVAKVARKRRTPNRQEP